MNKIINFFKGANGKRTLIVSLIAIVITGGSAFGVYKYYEYKREEALQIELAKKAEEERKAKQLEEELKLKKLRDENGIEGIADRLNEKYNGFIEKDEYHLALNYEEYMMTTHKVDDFDKYKKLLDEMVATLDERVTAYEAEQQRIAEEKARKAREAEEAAAAQQAQQSQQSSGGQNYSSGSSGDGVLTPSGGVNWFNGRKETYYNLDMSQVVANAHAMGIQGDYWVRGDGVKMLGNYIMVAASDLSKGTVIETSLGTGIVVDAGCAAGVTDVAVTW